MPQNALASCRHCPHPGRWSAPRVPVSISSPGAASPGSTARRLRSVLHARSKDAARRGIHKPGMAHIEGFFTVFLQQLRLLSAFCCTAKDGKHRRRAFRPPAASACTCLNAAVHRQLHNCFGSAKHLCLFSASRSELVHRLLVCRRNPCRKQVFCTTRSMLSGRSLISARDAVVAIISSDAYPAENSSPKIYCGYPASGGASSGAADARYRKKLRNKRVLLQPPAAIVRGSKVHNKAGSPCRLRRPCWKHRWSPPVLLIGSSLRPTAFEAPSTVGIMCRTARKKVEGLEDFHFPYAQTYLHKQSAFKRGCPKRCAGTSWTR